MRNSSKISKTRVVDAPPRVARAATKAPALSVLGFALLVGTSAWAEPARSGSPAPEEPSSGSSTSPTPGSGSGSQHAVDDSQHAVELRGLEEQVNDLKERVFRSKARLVLLREAVLSGAIVGARARILHRNEMGGAFTLRKASYSLDGTPIFTEEASDRSLGERREIEIFNGSIVPGNHNLAVYLEYQGHGFGLFSYLKGYTFKITSSYAFTAEEGKFTTVQAVPYEKGGFTTDLRDRPAIRYDVEIKQESTDPQAPVDGRGE